MKVINPPFEVINVSNNLHHVRFLGRARRLLMEVMITWLSSGYTYTSCLLNNLAKNLLHEENLRNQCKYWPGC